MAMAFAGFPGTLLWAVPLKRPCRPASGFSKDWDLTVVFLLFPLTLGYYCENVRAGEKRDLERDKKGLFYFYFLFYFSRLSPIMSAIREWVFRSVSPVFSSHFLLSSCIIGMLVSSGRLQIEVCHRLQIESVIEMKQIKRKIFLSLLRRGTLPVRAIVNCVDTDFFVKKKKIFWYSNTNNLGTEGGCPNVTLYWRAAMSKCSSRMYFCFWLTEWDIWRRFPVYFPSNTSVYSPPREIQS